jgi:hypothetical protein
MKRLKEKDRNLDFKVLDQPLKKAVNQVITQLKNEDREPKKFYFILCGLLETSLETYKAIIKLVAKKPKFGAQAHILVRPLIDTLFNVAVLAEKPEEFSRQYELAGYRAIWEELEREQSRYGNDTNWKSYLNEKKRFLDASAKLFCLSDQEKEDPKNIKYWPIPSRILAGKMLAKEKRDFLKEIYDWRYGESSEWSHQKWTGMAIGVYGTMPERHQNPEKFESDAVYKGALFLLMTVSEIVNSCNYSPLVQNLRYIWTIVGNYFDEAADYYSLRYDMLLQEDAMNPV